MIFPDWKKTKTLNFCLLAKCWDIKETNSRHLRFASWVSREAKASDSDKSSSAKHPFLIFYSWAFFSVPYPSSSSPLHFESLTFSQRSYIINSLLYYDSLKTASKLLFLISSSCWPSSLFLVRLLFFWFLLYVLEIMLFVKITFYLPSLLLTLLKYSCICAHALSSSPSVFAINKHAELQQMKKTFCFELLTSRCQWTTFWHYGTMSGYWCKADCRLSFIHLSPSSTWTPWKVLSTCTPFIY